MAKISSITSQRAQQIEQEILSSGQVVNGHLILTKRSGEAFDAGSVIMPSLKPYSVTKTVARSATYTTTIENTFLSPLELTVVTPPAGAVYEVELLTNLEFANWRTPTSVPDIIVSLKIDGTAHSSQMIAHSSRPAGSIGAFTFPASRSWYISDLAPGSHTFQIFAYQNKNPLDATETISTSRMKDSALSIRGFKKPSV